MRRGRFLIVAAAATALPAADQRAGANNPRVDNIEYLHGIPGEPNPLRGALQVGAHGLRFASGDHRVTLEREAVDYIAAQAQARQRAMMADIGSFLAAQMVETGATSAIAIAPEPAPPLVDFRAIFTPLLGAAPFLYLLREKDECLLTVEYLEGEAKLRRLILFRVRDNSATAVKQLIDQSLGLTVEHYRHRDREAERRRREFEQRVTPVGLWEAPRNTVVGRSRHSRILVEKGKYEVLPIPSYIGLKPADMPWAKYRIPVRECRAVGDPQGAFQPLFEDRRLAGFEAAGISCVFY